VPVHCRMRAFDRDLIRGGHYGQRSWEPRKQAEHMAAPTNAANVKKVLANTEPSTHGTFRTFVRSGRLSAYDPDRTFPSDVRPGRRPGASRLNNGLLASRTNGSPTGSSLQLAQRMLGAFDPPLGK
jgi:hypothetical protein